MPRFNQPLADQSARIALYLRGRVQAERILLALQTQHQQLDTPKHLRDVCLTGTMPCKPDANRAWWHENIPVFSKIEERILKSVVTASVESKRMVPSKLELQLDFSNQGDRGHVFCSDSGEPSVGVGNANWPTSGCEILPESA